MKPNCFMLPGLATGALLGLLASGLAQNAPSKGNKPPANPAVAVSDVAAIPKAVFEANVGRDPFFPRSSRNQPVVVGTNSPSVSTADLKLKGVTGPPKRSALINNRTFEMGEEADVRLPDGTKTRVRCLEIKDDMVIIEAGEPPRRLELHLRSGL